MYARVLGADWRRRYCRAALRIESVKFVEVNPQGLDAYDVQYANGAVRWTILLGPDGKTATAGVRRMPPSQ